MIPIRMRPTKLINHEVDSGDREMLSKGEQRDDYQKTTVIELTEYVPAIYRIDQCHRH